MDIQTTTTIMQYIIGALMALLPACVWGFIFYQKSPENKKTILISFLGGALSVIPMFIWQKYWSLSFSLGPLKVDHINIYSFITTFSNDPSLSNFLIFLLITMVVSLLIYLSASVIIFFMDIIFGKSPKKAFQNTFSRSLEEPLIFIINGLVIACFVAFVAKCVSLFAGEDLVIQLVKVSFWSSMMVGFLEEYTKHLVVRFADDDVIYSIDSAIQFSIIVALGFASFENIIYFIDRLWLAPCSQAEIANNECLFDPATGEYMHQVGVILIPFIFRSILSTLAHLVFSGIFGYFYGIAHFSSYQLKQIEQKKWGMRIWGTIHKIFGFRTRMIFHEVKMLEGLFLAMFVHGLFDFFLDQEKAYLTVPMIFLGYMYLSYLFQKKENHKKLRLISGTRTSERRRQMKKAETNIELLGKYEEQFQEYQKKQKHRESLDQIGKNIELLEKYEQLHQKDQNKSSDAAPPDEKG